MYNLLTGMDGIDIHSCMIITVLAVIAALFAAAFAARPRASLRLLSSSRLSRHIYYTAVTGAGFLMAACGPHNAARLPLLYPAALAVLINLLFASSAALNNVFDAGIDLVNSKENALNSGGISRGKYLALFAALAALSLALAAAMSPQVLAAAAAIHLASFIYSSPPFRLKRIFPLNVMLISFSTVLALFLGFAVPAGRDALALFPWRLATALFAGMSFAFNTKDVNDYEGDKKYGVRTVMTLLGPSRGKPTAAVLAFAGYLALPIILGSAGLMAAAVPAGLATMLLIILPKKRICEPAVFAVFFAFAACLIIMNPGLY